MKLRHRRLTNQHLKRSTKRLKYFRGVFVRNRLPIRINTNEASIVYLDSYDGSGTQWAAHNKGSLIT